MKARDLVFMGATLEDLREFPRSIRALMGAELRRVQRGEKPFHGRSMTTVGPGTYEVKVNDRQGAFRVFYVARFEEAVYVLHAFQKKSRKTSRRDIALGRQRYGEMVGLRNDEGY